MNKKTLASSLVLPAAVIVIVGATACAPLRGNPRSVCADDRTLSALYAVLARTAFADDKVDQQEISKLAAFEAIAFQRYNKDNGHLECRGVVTFKAPDYTGFGEASGVFTFSRNPLTKGGRFVYSMDPFPSDTAEKAAVWSQLIKPPILPSDFDKIASWRVVDAAPAEVGDCTLTKVTKKSTRIQEQIGAGYADVPGTGSAIMFENGVYQVSYDTLPAVESSAVGDLIKLCLIQLPLDCPRGDERGKVYSALDLRTGYDWFLPDSEHMCGGA